MHEICLYLLDSMVARFFLVKIRQSCDILPMQLMWIMLFSL